jgi:hypothetical protein
MQFPEEADLFASSTRVGKVGGCWVGVVQPANYARAEAARSESNIKSRVIGTASRLVDSSI